MCVCARRGVVRQLTRCANDHLTAESHYVLQQHTALYCLCCHSDIVFSTIKCWYWLIVLASSGLFFLHTHTHTHTRCRFILSVFWSTHMHTHTLPFFYSLCIFLRPVSTGLPWDQSRAVDLPYHKTSVVWSKSVGAVLEVFHRAPPLQMSSVCSDHRGLVHSYASVGWTEKEGEVRLCETSSPYRSLWWKNVRALQKNVFNAAAAFLPSVLFLGAVNTQRNQEEHLLP